jgi:hypothetical protein
MPVRDFSLRRGTRDVIDGAAMIFAGAIMMVGGGVEVSGAIAEEIVVQFDKLYTWSRKRGRRASA